jgi:hypothetical protein
MSGMSLRRWLAVLCIGLASVTSQAAADDEAAVRAALQRCVDGWNAHVPKVFGDCLTADVWFSEANDSFYKRFVGRDKVLGMFDYNIRNTDLQWQVVRIQPLPDGSMAVPLKQRIGILPLKDGKYAMSFDSDPSLARLRREGSGWKVYFFTSDSGWARALIEELEARPKALTPPVTAAARTAPAVAAGAAGTEPPAYTAPFGEHAQGCVYCHGRPPVLSEDPKRGRIVATGAAAVDGAALRRAMTQPHLGGMMNDVLADPALTDEALEGIRRWLVSLRDGRAELQPDRIVIHNPRSDRDPPARITQLRAEGGWRLPRDASCRVSTSLAGGASCEIRLTGGERGALVFRFADAPGLHAQPVRVQWPAP